MRALLTPSVRPRIGPSHSFSNISIRRTVFPPTRRKLTLCDAFTILLAPVLTAAFVADITHKDRRRQAWDKKIAQIQEEIEVLKERELKSWSTLQLRSVRAGVVHQRRSYSTAAIAVSPKNVDGEFLDDIDSSDMDIAPTNMTETPSEDLLAAWHRYENLIAVKTGLQMLLHIHTGRDPLGRLTLDEVINTSSTPDSIDSLVQRLRDIHIGLKALRDKVSQCYPDVSDHKEREELDAEILGLTWECRTGNISVPELILGYTKAVMKSQTGPSIKTYRLFAETFSTLDNQPLIYLSMYPFRNTRQILTDRTIWTMIYQYGKIKDAKRFDQFLTLLLIRRRWFMIANDWEIVDVDGVRVATPVNRRPRLLDILLRSALQNNQPHRARAWAVLLLEQGISTGRIAALVNNFLTYCSEHVDWMAGQSWLKKTVVWAALLAETSPQMLQKIVFRMLDLCVSCGQPQYYEKILAAAITAGLDVPPEDDTRPDFFSSRAREIREHWSSQIRGRRVCPVTIEGIYEAAKIFQTELGKLDSSVNEFIGVKDLKRLPALLGKSSTSSALRTEPSSDGLANPSDVGVATSSEIPTEQVFEASGGASSTNSELERHLRLLQAAHEDLLIKYHAQQMVNTELQRVGSKAQQKVNIGHQVQQLARQLARNQEQNTQLQDHNTHLREKMDRLGHEKVQLQSELVMSNESKLRLDELCGQLRSQLGDTARQSKAEAEAQTYTIQAVSSENDLLKQEISDLKSRYILALGAKDKLEERLGILQIQHNKLKNGNSSDVQHVQQAQKVLETRLYETRLHDQKLPKTNLAGEGISRGNIAASARKVKDVRTESDGTKKAQMKGRVRNVGPKETVSDTSCPKSEELRGDFSMRRFQSTIQSGA